MGLAYFNYAIVLMNYAIDNGYAYDRWKKIVTMMIEEEQIG